MNFKKYLYISSRVFKREILLNLRVIILIFLFFMFNNIFGTMSENLKNTKIKSERYASSVIIDSREYNERILSDFENEIEEIVHNESEVIVITHDMYDAYVLKSYLQSEGYSVSDYGDTFEYHSVINELAMKAIKVIYITEYSVLGIVMFIIFMRKIINDEAEYSFLMCLGFKRKQIIRIIASNTAFFLIPSAVGWIISIILNKLINILGKDYLLYFDVFNIRSLILSEAVIIMLFFSVLALYVFRTKNQKISAVFERRI